MKETGNKSTNKFKKAMLYVAVLFVAFFSIILRGIKFVWGYIAYVFIRAALYIAKLFRPLYIKTTGLRTLVKMQLKDKIDMSWLRSKKGIIFKTVFTIIGFAVITVAIWGILKLCVLTPILSVTGRLDAKIIVFVFTIMQVLSIITVTLGLSKSLYFADDNKMLLTLPVKPDTLFFSKIIVYYITELKKSFSYMMPLFAAFGILNGYPLIYFLIAIVGFLFVALFVVLLSALLSIPAMFVTSFLKRNPYIQMGVLAIVLSAIALGFIWLMGQVPANLNLILNIEQYFTGIRDFLEYFQESIAVPFYYLTHMLAGEEAMYVYHAFTLTGLFTLLVLIGSIGILSLASWFLARPLFFRMTSKQFEYRKNTIKRKHQNKKHNEFASSFKKELILNTRTPSAFFSTFVFVFILPFAILLLNTIFTSMATSLRGNMMCIAFNVLIMLLILLTNNTSNASLFSKEGAAVYLLKTKPATYISSMFSKISLNYLLSVISLVLATVFLQQTLAVGPAIYMPIFFIVLFVFTAHLLWSVDMDITNPQYKFYHDGVHSTTNPNEIKSTVLAFVLSLFFFGWTFFLMLDDAKTVWIKIMLIAMALLGLRVYLNLSKAKVYFKDI
ncbi:MAG: hypothetical protein LBN07_04640 [Christensenellaceae bacterium]|jgi:hypothetical protein|nr:hypothetical protein [Christensenellaceae bacterium]